MTETTQAWIALKAEMRKSRAWWASYDPVAYLWLRRAERRGAVVPWSEKASVTPVQEQAAR